MSLEWKETAYKKIFVHPSGRVIDRSTGKEFVGPVIQVTPTLRVGRAMLILTTFSPPPPNVRSYVVYKDNDSHNWALENLSWRVDVRDLIRVAESAPDDELAQLMPTLVQLAPTISHRLDGLRFEDHPDVFTTH